MKRLSLGLGIFFIISTLTAPSLAAFRDVRPDSKLTPAAINLAEKAGIPERGFFRPELPVTAELFWKAILNDSGFNAEKAATFQTPLPPNIKEDDPLAQYLREGRRRGFIDSDVNFDRNGTITRIQAIRTLVKTKALPIPRRNSVGFRRKVTGTPTRAPYLLQVEAALASNLLAVPDIQPLHPSKPLTRRKLAEWLQRYNEKGIRKAQYEKSAYQKPSVKNTKPSRKKRTAPSRKKKVSLRIETLTGGADPDRSNLKIPNGGVLQSVFQKIEENYRFADDLDEDAKRAMVDAAITTLVKKLGDKYSSYIEPSKTKDFKSGLEGKFEGIGAYVEMIDDKFTITAPIKGSPAEEAGIMPGDIVTHVDDEDIAGQSTADIIAKIKGPAGTNVRITLRRDGRLVHVTVVRGKITIPSVTVKFKKGVPIVSINQFTHKTAADLRKILAQEVLTKNPRGIILDFRNDPGGFLTAAIKVGELFLDEGQEIFSVEYRTRKEIYKTGRKGELFGQKRIVVLQNKGTASASEIVIGMLQDYEIATVIGSKSLGKGTVQEISNYPNGASLKLTIAKWLTPKGRWIHEKGIIPDIKVTDPTSNEKAQKIDRQLDRAISFVLQGR